MQSQIHIETDYHKRQTVRIVLPQMSVLYNKSQRPMVWVMYMFEFGVAFLCMTYLHNCHTHPKQTNRHRHLFTNQYFFVNQGYWRQNI